MKLLQGILLLLIMMLCLVSCSKQDSEQLGGLFQGVVYDDATNLRIPDVSVAVYDNCEAYLENGGGMVVGRDFTDQGGNFSVELPNLSFEDLCARINSEPTNDQFSTGLFYVASGNEYFKEIRLTHYTRLQVVALLDIDTFVTDLELTVPGESCSCNDLTTSKASGNHYNTIEWTVTTPEGSVSRSDSIYCPIGETTEFIIQL